MIQIPGTQINYPVVQGKDNDYYLHRDLNGQKSTAGTIFLDYADRADFSSLHNVLYGHHMKNGSMFKDISRYKDQGYFDQHSEIILYTPEREIHLKAPWLSAHRRMRSAGKRSLHREKNLRHIFSR
ncbi:MAG: class B sortase [Clostridium fessum]